MKMRKADVVKLIAVSIVFVAAFAIGYQILKPQKKLPIYNPVQLDKRLVDDAVQNVGRNHKVLPFALLNQYGDTLRDTHVAGKIRVVDFFFTTCPGICKDMAVQMRRLQEVYAQDPEIVLLSHSVTPEIDSLEVIAAYADLQGAIKGKWYILTGNKRAIYTLARQSYFAVLDEGGTGDENDFIHTENFILVDTEDRIRGFYDGTSAEDIDRLVEDIAVLKQEG
jgi:protein SCO1/2